MPGEFDLIDWIRQTTAPADTVPLGVGDDLAGLRWGGDDLLLVGVDQVLDGVHFDSARHSPRDIGAKAMNRNLSDCAAMAALPAAAVVTLALPAGRGLDYARELQTGIAAAGAAFGCPVVGGDTGSWPGGLVVTVTILGRSAGVEPVRRSGAKVGDTLYVSGLLGGSIHGRHLHFSPRIHLARRLAATGRLTAMIDLSDGLSRDLPHLCRQSNCGAIVVAEQLPIHPDVKLYQGSKRSAVEHALHDGEDYELLFTATGELPPSLGVVPIGRIVSGGDILLQTAGLLSPLQPLAWQHSL